MISFYPGPSRIHSTLSDYFDDAVRTGILSANHRSAEFVDLSRRTIQLLRKKLGVPDDYTVFFTSSATECWEIIAQSLIREKSLHVYNGAFGQKWYDYTRRIRTAGALPFGLDNIPEATIPEEIQGDILCLTQNETSNGTQVGNATLALFRQSNPDALIAVDATSSMGGISLNFSNADIWFASVQKCFGLPAGLGLMFCSPRAIARAMEINETAHYNSLVFMKQMMDKWQTSYTPNVLAIYLLMRVLKDADPIGKTDKKIRERYDQWIAFLGHRKFIHHLVRNEEARSYTVIPVQADPTIVSRIKSEARDNGLSLGEGYGEWRESTFRIANFPALKKREIKTLMRFLRKF